MKAYFVALLIASSILLNLVDTGNYEVQDSTEHVVPDFAEEPQICGPNTFSNSVRLAFIRESDLEKYSPRRRRWHLSFRTRGSKVLKTALATCEHGY